MLKIYREELLIRTCNADMSGAWRMSAILEAMQEAAGVHATLLGCGREALLRENIVWVISRSEVVMEREARVGERITVETFPMPGRHGFFPRYFNFYDESGARIGSAATLWVLLDLTDRHLAISKTASDCIPDNSDLTAPMPLPRAVRPIAGEAVTSVRTPVYSELDVNGHVNNTRYADWLTDALGIEMLKKQRIRRLHIVYTAEVLPAQTLDMVLTVNGDSARLVGKCADREHFSIACELELRNS